MEKTIATLTDFGLKDNFVGVMKAVILKINPKVDIIDLCHGIEPQQVIQGALILRSSYRFFPKQTIFACVIDPGVGSNRKAVIVKTADYTFLAPDNGLLSFVFEEEKNIQIYEIANPKYFLKPVSQTFHGRDIFAPIAAHLSRGVLPKTLGPRIPDIKTLYLPTPHLNAKKDKIDGEIIYIDSFGNLISNINEEYLREFKGKITVTLCGKMIHDLQHAYGNVAPGMPLAIINSMGYLEISINNGSARDLLKAHIGSAVKISGR